MSRSNGLRSCPREDEIVELVMAGQLTSEGAAALRAHAGQCRACAETLELAALLREDQRTLCDAAAVPSSGAVWWRATIRARADAARTAGQPITLLQGVAAATVVGLFFGLVTAWWRSSVPGGTLFGRVGELLSGSGELSTMTALSIFVAAAACLIVAPLAVYFATADEP